MEIQPITYRGRAVAACTASRVFFSDDLEARSWDDPLRCFVEEMCQYAGEVLVGLAPGPYRDEDARAYARRMLIPRELLEWPRPAAMVDPERVARELSVPLQELFVELGRTLRARQRRTGIVGLRCERRAR
jgi:hypothetical protein